MILVVLVCWTLGLWASIGGIGCCCMCFGGFALLLACGLFVVSGFNFFVW